VSSAVDNVSSKTRGGEEEERSIDPELMYDTDTLIVMLERVTVLFDRYNTGLLSMISIDLCDINRSM